MREPISKKEFDKMLESGLVVSKNGILVFNKQDKPEKHTEDIQEIITRIPSWIVRWGITLLFSTILIIVAISVLVPYPEMVKSSLKLQSFGNTVIVAADTPGRIIKVFVQKNSAVKKRQPLIEIKKDIDQKTYILKAPNDGRVGFSAIVQAGSLVEKNQQIFKIHPVNEHFFGVMYIPKYDINKIKLGQQVIIKQIGSPSGGNNAIQGKVDFAADEPINNHFLIKVAFTKSSTEAENFKMHRWMEFEAQIITKKSNLFHKVFGGIIDVYNTI